MRRYAYATGRAAVLAGHLHGRKRAKGADRPGRSAARCAAQANCSGHGHWHRLGTHHTRGARATNGQVDCTRAADSGACAAGRTAKADDAARACARTGSEAHARASPASAKAASQADGDALVDQRTSDFCNRRLELERRHARTDWSP